VVRDVVHLGELSSGERRLSMGHHSPTNNDIKMSMMWGHLNVQDETKMEGIIEHMDPLWSEHGLGSLICTR